MTAPLAGAAASPSIQVSAWSRPVPPIRPNLAIGRNSCCNLRYNRIWPFTERFVIAEIEQTSGSPFVAWHAHRVTASFFV
jgi:hypothetical protein